MASPIEIRLLATKPIVIAGEEPVLTLGLRVNAPLDMETVELNRARTVIRIEPAAEGAEAIVLTGQDHIRTHSIHPLTEVGARFQAPAGSAWTTPLHLLDYGATLSAGRYRVSLTYRYGETEEETAASNPVEVGVIPAAHLSNSYRWLAGATPYADLANLWRAEAGGELRWMYQVAGRKNPGAVRVAVAVAVPEGASAYTPVLAHINDIASMHYERFAVWTEAEQLGCIRVQQEGATRELRRFPHGLTAASVVDPPLQGLDGSLAVVLAGTHSFVLLRIASNGAVARTEIPFDGGAPAFAYAAWPADKGPEEGIVYWGRRGETQMFATQLRLPVRTVTVALPGRVAAMAMDQWNGAGRVTALLADGTSLEVAAVAILSAPALTVSPISDRTADKGIVFHQFAATPGKEQGALLLRGAGGWLAEGFGEEKSIPVEEHLVHPHLVATPSGGPWMVGFDPDRGFVAERLAPPEPPPLI